MKLLNSILKPSVLIPALIICALALVPFAATSFGESFYISFFARIIIYAIAASSLNLILGYGGMVSFGHALYLGLGAYSVALPAFYGIDNGLVHLLVCVVSCALVGLVTGVISLRTTGIAFIMITLAFAQMGYFLFVSLKQFGGDDGVSITQTSNFFGINFGSATVIYIAAFVTLIFVTYFLARIQVSPFGMTLRGTHQNTRRVNAIGLSVIRYQLTAYVISAIICGVAGLLLANLNAFASPSTLSWMVSGELIVMVVLGGMGSVFGPVLGAILFLGLEEILKSYTEHWMAVFGPFIVLIAILGKNGVVSLLLILDEFLSCGVAKQETKADVPTKAGELA